MKILNPKRLEALPSAVLFDLDNTLYPYDPSHAAGMAAVRAKVVRAYSIAESDFDTAFDEARRQVKSRLGHTAASHSRLLYVQRMMEIMGLGSQMLMSLDLEQTYWRTFLGTAQLFDEVLEFLDDLRLLSIPTAVVTDLTAQIQFRKMVFFGLDQLVDHIVTSEEAGCDKPSDLPFTLALDKLQPDDGPVWMVGDSKVDIVGAREVGAVAIQKLHGDLALGVGEGQPDAAFREFPNLRKLVRSLAEQRV